MSLFGGRRQPPEPSAAPASKPPAPPRQPVGFETVLGASTSLLGDLRSQGNVRMDGIFEGTLEIDGNVLVGETAKISADINARNISIAGAVRGNVNGNKVQILRTGRVWGDIHARAITTEEGAFIDGKIKMVQHEAADEQAGEGALLEALPEEEPDFLAAVDAQRAREADEALVALDDELDMTVPDAEADDLAGPPLADDDLLRDLSADLPVDEDGAVG